jgi:hypothetical protein
VLVEAVKTSARPRVIPNRRELFFLLPNDVFSDGRGHDVSALITSEIWVYWAPSMSIYPPVYYTK